MGRKTYRIGEAAELLRLKSYVLRFWETEFVQLTPLRTEKGQRLYTEEHLELLRRIRHLLHVRGMTIDGARRILNAEFRSGTAPENASQERHPQEERGVAPEVMRELRKELLALRDLLAQQ